MHVPPQLINRRPKVRALGGREEAEARKAVENELIAEAIAAFRGRAEIAQKALGGRAFKVQRISVGSGFAGPPPRLMMQARGMADAAVAPPPAEGGASTLSVTVGGAVEVE